MILKLLATYYLLQGLLLAALGFGGVILMDQDHELVMQQWLHLIHLDPENRHIHGLLTRAFSIDDHQLEALSIGSFVYAALALVQGGGLLYGRRWASYLTVVMIASFLPFELYAVMNHVTPLRVTALGVNGVIVWYLIARELHVRPRRNANVISC
ncbi:MAG TPA: DUF2127 domain-containing protein [Nitrospiraceae bacterium]|nr:DUF2127 domain-containing protein [Nitrospiraceae bacterium]